VIVADDGLRLVKGLRPGDWCALHWDWLCDRLSPRQRSALQHYTARNLTAVNATSHPAPAAVLS
jgi:hypothetical protein